MSLLFLDGFDKYAAKADLALRSYSNLAAMDLSVEAGAGRFGGNGLLHVSGERLGFEFGTQTGQVNIAFWIKVLEGITTNEGRWFAIKGNTLFGEGGAYVSTPSTDGKLQLEGFTTSALSNYLTGTDIDNPFVPGTNHHVEIHFLPGSSGIFQLIVDGTMLINFSGDTFSGLGGFFHNLYRFEFGPIGSTGGTIYDDLVIWKTTGYAPTGTLNPHRIDTLTPTADGDIIDFTPLSGSNVSNIDDPAFADNVDYNSTNVVTDIDIFQIENLPVTPETIHGIQVVNRAKSSSTTDGALSIVQSGSSLASGAAFTLALTYKQASTFFPFDPATLHPWSISSINAVQVGLEFTDGVATPRAIAAA